MRAAPRLDPCDRCGTTVVVLILGFGEPLNLAGLLARRPARRRGTESLVMRVARIGGKEFTAIQALPLLALPHVAPLARPMTQRLHDRKKTEENPDSEEDPSF
jgi:hypothetical protein